MRLLMRSRARVLLLLPLVLSIAVGVAPPADAQDQGGGDEGQQPPEPEDQHSPNMKLVRALGPSAEGVVQSDLAFWGNYAVAGNYQGFRIIDISKPSKATVVGEMFCNGAQGDVSIWKNLVFQSVDAPQSHEGCDSTNVTAAEPGMFEGIRVFDISDKANPVHVTSIQPDCGSHTHTLLPKKDKVYIYISSYPLGGAAQGPDCQQPHGYVSIIEVPLDDPTGAEIHEHALDEDTEIANYDLTLLGAPQMYSFTACHDMSVFVELELLAAACMSESQLWDISDPLNPQLKWRFDDPIVDPGKVDLWHSSTFNWDGSIVAFGDESGGGGLPRCLDPDDQQGRIWFLDTKTGELLANYKIPRSEEDICTMHNFNFVPRRDGRNVLVSSAYTGGTTVVDVDKLIGGASEAEAEIGWYKPTGGSAWSSYWYNRYIYANDHDRGVDIFRLRDRLAHRTVRLPFLNPQTQHNVIQPKHKGKK